MQALEIFKAGNHTSASGVALSFSESDLEATVRAYDPALHEAPIVIGHPKDNGPAYGWVSGLEYADGALVAKPSQVDPQFAEIVAAGRFKKRSASFYSPDSPQNPVPGVYYLRHVGFLGAQPPAVKGLRDVAFSEEEGVVEFADDGMVTGILALMMRRLRDFFIAEYGVDKAQGIIPDFMVQDIEAAARAPSEEPYPAPAFSDPREEPSMTMTPEQIAELEAKAARADELQAALEKRDAEFAELSSKQAEADKAAALVGIKAEIEPHVQAGRVLPAEVDSLASFAASLDAATETVDFVEGEETRKVSARALFLSQLGRRPVAVDFSERAPGGDTEGSQTADSADLARKARAYAEQRRSAGDQISFTEAVDAVLSGKA